MSTQLAVVRGLLKPDGTLELDSAPAFPPGRVKVTLQALPANEIQAERLPDPPLLDDNISAPCDLPIPGKTNPVVPQFVAERLPDPIEWAVGEEE